MINLIQISISLGLETWLLILLVRRRVHRHFLAFFLYTVYTTAITVPRLLAAGHYKVYFYVYWWTDVPLLLMSLVALHEVFRWAFEGFHRLWWFRAFYYGTACTVLGLAVRHALVNPPLQARPFFSLVLDIEMAMNLLLAGLVVLFYGLAMLVELDFRRYAFGIAVGFGISSAGSFLGFLFRSGFGTRLNILSSYFSSVSYILGLVLWVIAFIRPEPEAKAWIPPMPPEQMRSEVEGYLKALGFPRKEK
jgi:hypothetical protein